MCGVLFLMSRSDTLNQVLAVVALWVLQQMDHDNNIDKDESR
jgi:hypothetical protein